MGRTRKRAQQPPKTLSSTAIKGQRGINTIERFILDMGSRWSPSGPGEVGIDGYIELFDPASGHALGTTIAAQSKALTTLAHETADGFDYWCEQRDLDYWLAGNWPVILVICRARTDEAYWVSIQDYFATPERRKSTKVSFKKSEHRFSKDSFRALAQLAVPRAGLYLAPARKTELLHSNLLPIDELPNELSIADTDCRSAHDVWTALRNEGSDADAAWILSGKRIYAFHDLGNGPWRKVCDVGTHERFPTADWSHSTDPDRRRIFVNLLNLTLKGQVGNFARYWPREDCYAIKGRPRKIGYTSLKRTSRISAITQYSKKVEDGRTFVWWRHLAFHPQFRFLDGTWYLEITPTYLFMKEGGVDRDRFHEDRLRGIKRLEGNRAVLSCVLLWASLLRPSQGLFDIDAPLIKFGELSTFSLDVGIDDKQWLARDPETSRLETVMAHESLLPDFELESEP